MKCDKCGAPSVYRSTLIVNGVSQTTNLCRDCAIKEGVFNQKTSLFDDLFSSFSDLLGYEKVENLQSALTFIPNEYCNSLDLFALDAPNQTDMFAMGIIAAVTISCIACAAVVTVVIVKIKNKKRVK